MVVLDAVAEELRRAGLARDQIVLQARLAGRAAVVVDDFPHSLADFLKLIGRYAAILEKVAIRFDRLLLEEGPVLGDDLFHKVRLVDRSPVRDGGSDDGHLERGRQDEPLPDGGVGGVPRTPTLARIILGEPGGARKGAGSDVVEREFRFLAKAEHFPDRIDLVDAGDIAVLEEVGVAGILDGVAEVLVAVGRLLRLGGEHPALHVLVAVLDAARAVEILVPDACANTRQRGAELEGGSGRIGVDGTVHERIGWILGKLIPVGLGDGGDELVGIERGNRRHCQDLAGVGIHDDRRPAADDTQRLLDDLLDAGVDGQVDLGARLGLDPGGLAVDHTARIALEEARAGSAAQHVIVSLLDLRFPLDVGLVEVELRSLLLVDLLGDADVTEEMRGERPVDVVAHRLERHGDAGKVEVVLAEAGHCLEVEILPVDEGNLRIVAVVHLQLAHVVVAGKAELLESWNDRLVDDLDDVGLLLECAHAVIEAPVFAFGHGTMLLLPRTDDVGEVELHLHARAVFHEWNAVAVADLTAHRGKADRQLRMPLDPRPVGFPLDDLHIPHAHDQQEKRGGEDSTQDQDLA